MDLTTTDEGRSLSTYGPAGRWLLSLLLRSWVPGHMGIPGRYPRAYDGVRAASLGATRREKRIVYVRCPGLPPGGRSMGNNTPLSDAQALTALGTLWYHRRTGKFTCCPQQPLQSPSSWLDARRSRVSYSTYRVAGCSPDMEGSGGRSSRSHIGVDTLVDCVWDTDCNNTRAFSGSTAKT